MQSYIVDLARTLLHSTATVSVLTSEPYLRALNSSYLSESLSKSDCSGMLPYSRWLGSQTREESGEVVEKCEGTFAAGYWCWCCR